LKRQRDEELLQKKEQISVSNEEKKIKENSGKEKFIQKLKSEVDEVRKKKTVRFK